VVTGLRSSRCTSKSRTGHIKPNSLLLQPTHCCFLVEIATTAALVPVSYLGCGGRLRALGRRSREGDYSCSSHGTTWTMIAAVVHRRWSQSMYIRARARCGVGHAPRDLCCISSGFPLPANNYAMFTSVCASCVVRCMHVSFARLLAVCCCS